MENFLETLCQPTTGVRLLWTGNDGWLIWDGYQLIATDLDFTNPLRKEPPLVDLDAIAQKLQLHFISHGHEDHFNTDTCRVLLEKGNCQFVVPKSCEEKAREMQIPSQRCQIASSGAHFTIAGVEISCIRAIHGHIGGSVYCNATPFDCGYRFRFAGLQFYQPGDTLLLEEHGLMDPVDVLFVSPTEHNTWIEHSKQLIAFLKPRWILAQHFGTYTETSDNWFWTYGHTQELRDALPPQIQEHFYIPTPTSVIELSDGQVVRG